MKILAAVILSLCIMDCSNQKTLQKPLTAGEMIFDKQGHRGCRGLMPENTIPAMLKAIDLGVTTLELDIVITKDKKVILSHEPWFGREITTKPDGTYMGNREERRYNIYWMTYEETKTFDVGLKPHPRFPDQQKMRVTKPLLEDVIDSVNNELMSRKRPAVRYNIEIKSNPAGDSVFHPKPAEFVDLLMKVIKNKGLGELVTIQSFDFRPLRYLHEKYPYIHTAMLIEDFDKTPVEEQVRKLGFTASVYSPHFTLVNPALVKKCHELGMKIIPWTINDRIKMQELKDMGVDGIISDYPGLFASLE